MSASLRTEGRGPIHPLDYPEIARKIHSSNELVEKIREMEAVTLFVAAKEHSALCGQICGLRSKYTYIYFTNKNDRDQFLDEFEECLFDDFEMSAVKDKLGSIYKVSYKATLVLTKLKVKNHFKRPQRIRDCPDGL
jgi:CRISPR/Cas system Type II protein with McrA/HNH and RuvC-like nuclease domain